MLGPSIIFEFSRATRPSVKPPRPTNGQKIGHLDDVLMTSRTHFPPLALHFPFFKKKNHPPAVNLRWGCTLGQVPTLEGCTSRGLKGAPSAHTRKGGDPMTSGCPATFIFFFFLQCASALTRVRTFFLKKKKKSRQWRPLRNKK